MLENESYLRVCDSREVVIYAYMFTYWNVLNVLTFVYIYICAETYLSDGATIHFMSWHTSQHMLYVHCRVWRLRS